MKTTHITTVFAACLALALFLQARPLAADASYSAVKQDRETLLLLPSPGELFITLERIGGEVDWTETGSFNPRYDYGDNPTRALNLGVRAADGFLAIQARNKAKLGEMFVTIITLAEELMVQDTVLEQGKEVEKLARREEWEQVHLELGNLRSSIIAEMDRMGDADTALLVTAGGWLEGLRAASAALDQNYDPRASSVLYQPQLVDYFAQKLPDMDKNARTNPAVIELIKHLAEIRDLVDVGYQKPVPPENVAKLKEISARIVDKIEKS